MCDHSPNREAAMVVVADGVWCDPCLVPIIAALNQGGVQTLASCCGHGHRPGNIALADGRELVIAADFEQAREIDLLFPTDINGTTTIKALSEQHAVLSSALTDVELARQVAQGVLPA